MDNSVDLDSDSPRNTPLSSNGGKPMEWTPSGQAAHFSERLSDASLIDLLAAQTRELRELRLSVQALCEIQAPGHPRTRLHHESRNRDQAQRAWQEINAYDLLSHEPGNLDEYTSPMNLPLKEVLSGVHEFPWTSWAYRHSYPHLARYLDRIHTFLTPRLQVTCTDRTATKTIIRETKPPLHEHAALWRHISTRFTGPSVTRRDATGVPSDPRMCAFALTRTLQVRDLDPTLAIMLMASTPRIHVSMIAAFLDRYIAFRNWASASSWALRNQTRNAYVFEYHLAFYSVSSEELHPDRAVRDHRGLRRSAVFGPNDDEKDRWIHEEQLSFFLVGMGSKVFTCYQLAERYHNSPEASFPFRSERYDGPTAMFMNWLTSSFHHVAWRWQRIIDVLNHKIHTSDDIVFSAENPDLLADDPKFSRSKTYFWALQTYKMFDERLGETILAWEKFRRDRFYGINDGVLPAQHISLALDHIEASVEKLRVLQDRVRKKSSEVESLRHGLFGASALFDSRTSVRQGDNIRLLTYITLLFLPLTFTTSIYGMQVVLPNMPVIWFWGTLPCVIVVTALVVFNLQDIVDVYDAVASRVTRKLRDQMRIHHREEWREMGDLLKRDRAARQAPIRKIHRSTSHWDYVLFLLESIAFDLPVHEVTWLWRSFRHIRQQMGNNQKTVSEGNALPQGKDFKSRAARVMAVKHTEQVGLESRPPNKLNSAVNRVGRIMLTFTRLFMIPLWLLLILVEYFLILPSSILNPDEEFQSIGAPGSKAPKSLLVLVQPLVWVGFGRQKGSKATIAREDADHPSSVAKGASNVPFQQKSDAEEKAEALAKIVEHVAEKRRRARALRLRRRSMQGHGIRTIPPSPLNGRPRTGSATLSPVVPRAAFT